MNSFISFAAGAAAGAAAAHFLDPENGNRRRAVARDKALSKAKQGAAAAQSQAQYAAGRAKGKAADVAPSTGEKDYDDVTLARKVESEIFRAPDAPKGEVSVDVQAGEVYLRGAVSDESWIERLGEAAGQVEGVKGVKNLLHATGTPAPAPEPRGAVNERAGS
jgi:osmotically-inducible protein OsmY